MIESFDPASILRLAVPYIERFGHDLRTDVDDGLGRSLPSVVSVGALEIRLEAGADRIDYSFCIRSSELVRDRLRAAVFNGADIEETWAPILVQLERWSRHADRTGSTAVWVEVDVAHDAGGKRSYRPFMVHTLRESSRDDPAGRVSETRALAQEALDLDARDPLLEGLDALVRRLPPWCAVRHVALRPTSAHRLLRAICRMPCTRAAEFAGGGTDSPSGRSIRALTSKVFQRTSITNVNFDITPSLGSRVGVEFHFVSTPDEDRRWDVLFDELEKHDLLTPEKRTVIAHWPSPQAERSLQQVTPTTLVRDLLVKVDFDDVQAVQAKAYLPFIPACCLPKTRTPGTRAKA